MGRNLLNQIRCCKEEKPTHAKVKNVVQRAAFPKPYFGSAKCFAAAESMSLGLGLYIYSMNRHLLFPIIYIFTGGTVPTFYIEVVVRHVFLF